MQKFKVTYFGAVGIRSSFYEAKSVDDVRARWTLMWPNLAIINVERQ